jgi:hypothetical protein
MFTKLLRDSLVSCDDRIFAKDEFSIEGNIPRV